MKTLTKYLNEKLVIFPSQVYEKLVINKDYKDAHAYTCAPKTFEELRKIIEDRYDKLGPGTKQNPIDFNDVDVSDIDSFYDEDNDKGIFEDTKFKYINISDWDVSNVKNMNNAFWNCNNLVSVGDLSNWNVSNVKNMKRMFCICKQLKSVGDLSNWDVSNVENMDRMFFYCEKIKSVGDLSNWNVSKVTCMHSMFYSCEKLISIGDLSNWNVSKVRDMNYIFGNSGITNIPGWYKK